MNEAVTTDAAHVIVFGNEKGGSGKSTSAMHTAVALLRLGYRVGTIDLDARQGTLSRYMRNRWAFAAKNELPTPMPVHMAIEKSQAGTVETQQQEEQNFLMLALAELGVTCDFIVIDTPGSDSFLSRLAHSYADTLVTPLNDSLVDLDVLADIDPETHAIREPSIYTKMVSEQRKDGMRWLVMRNRLSHIDAGNKKLVGDLLGSMAEKFGFTLVHGFGERVIFKELFLKGLTLLDIKEDPNIPMTMSQISARQEVRQLILAVGPEKIKGRRRPDGFP